MGAVSDPCNLPNCRADLNCHSISLGYKLLKLVKTCDLDVFGGVTGWGNSKKSVRMVSLTLILIYNYRSE